MFDAYLAGGSGPVPADQSLIELLNNNDDVVNALEVGDSSSANSDISIKVTIPSTILNGEFLVVLVNRPVVHQMSAADNSAGLVDTNIQSTHYEDIMKELLDNNQIMMS
jgi:hypothetical protein